VLNNYGMDKPQSERLEHFPNVNSLLKISLGLILFTIISSALVYAETISIDIEGNSFDIDYTATGMTVSGIESDLGFFSLIFTVGVTDSSGTLDITFDRSFFDSTFEGEDDDFIVLIDDFPEDSSFTETETTSQSRTLSIQLPAGTETVEIIGSVFGESVAETEETMEEETMEEETMEEETMEEETMEEETMEEETVDDTTKTQCGPGTVLKDGACVLDERCGPGTVLKDGTCVLESTPQPSEITVKGKGSELVIGTIAAFGIAGAIGIILALISRAKQSKD